MEVTQKVKARARPRYENAAGKPRGGRECSGRKSGARAGRAVQVVREAAGNSSQVVALFESFKLQRLEFESRGMELSLSLYLSLSLHCLSLIRKFL